MSQFDWGTIDPNSKSGPQLAIDLNNFRDALNSCHRGASRPEYAKAGMLWVREVSMSQWDLVLFDGDTDFIIRSVNPATNALINIPSAQVQGLDTALAMSIKKDTVLTSGAAILPAGTAAQRPGAPASGMIRHNSDIGEMERYQGGKWLALNVLDKALNEAPIVTLASASTVSIGAAAANSINISGAVTIVAFDVIAAGATRRLVFQGVTTITHNADSLILPGGANISTSAGDIAEFISLGSGKWRCLSYTRANGSPLKGACSAWVLFNGSGSGVILGSHNVSSITVRGNGQYVVNFASNMDNADYAVVVVADKDSSAYGFEGVELSSRGLSSVVVRALSSTGANINRPAISVAIFGGKL